jgi:hypothetical protein
MASMVTTNARHRGIAALEVALTLAVLLMLTFGAIEYGWYFLKVQKTTNAARQGARIAAMPDATPAEVASLISALMADIGGSRYTVTITPSNIEEMPPGDMLTVSIVVPYKDNLELIGFPLIPVPENIHASVCMAKEGP